MTSHKRMTNLCLYALLYSACTLHGNQIRPLSPIKGDYQSETITSPRSYMTEVQIKLKKDGCLAGELHLVYNQHTAIGHIQYVRVDAHCRGTGLGSTLMRDALTQLGALGCKKVTLRACPLATDAITHTERLAELITFYQQFGFTLVPTDADLEDGYATSRRMEKNLGD